MAGTRIITRRITETENINRKDAGWMAPPLKNDRIESLILPDGIEFRNWN